MPTGSNRIADHSAVPSVCRVEESNHIAIGTGVTAQLRPQPNTRRMGSIAQPCDRCYTASMSFNSDVAIGVMNNLILQRRREREEAAKKALRDDANTAENSDESTGKEKTDSDRSS